MPHLPFLSRCVFADHVPLEKGSLSFLSMLYSPLVWNSHASLSRTLCVSPHGLLVVLNFCPEFPPGASKPCMGPFAVAANVLELGGLQHAAMITPCSCHVR